MPIQNIHATPIYYSQIDNFNNVQNELKIAIDQVNFKMKEEWGNTHYLSSTNFQDNFIGKYNLITFIEILKHNVKVYCDEIGFNKSDIFEITQSWVSLFKKNNYGHIHNHGTSDISGVYYYKTNQQDGDLFFEPANPHLRTSVCFFGLGSRFKYTPEEGKLILFPGWLRHGVQTNTTDNTRISISFNINFPRSGIEYK